MILPPNINESNPIVKQFIDKCILRYSSKWHISPPRAYEARQAAGMELCEAFDLLTAEEMYAVDCYLIEVDDKVRDMILDKAGVDGRW